jgi:hypothetical protein
MFNITGDLSTNPAQISISGTLGLSWQSQDCPEKKRTDDSTSPIVLARQKGRFSEPVHVWMLTPKCLNILHHMSLLIYDTCSSCKYSRTLAYYSLVCHFVYQNMVALNGNILQIEHKIIASITDDLVFNKIFQLYCDLC